MFEIILETIAGSDLIGVLANTLGFGLTDGLIYGFMVLGVFITFRILDFPDLTVDGSFPLGAAIMTMLIIKGVNIWLALLVAFIGGVVAGAVTAIIHNKLKIPALFAGILTMTMLYSINIRIMGLKPNLPLLREETIITKVVDLFYNVMPEWLSVLLLLLAATLILKLLIVLFFHTDLGLMLRAMGNNQQMVVTQGANPEFMKILGVGLSNGLVAIAGAFAAQYNGFSDVNLGQGIIISGLASVMIGEVFMPSRKLWVIILRAFVGSFIYRAIMFLALQIPGIEPSDNKLISVVLVILALVGTNYFDMLRKKRKGKLRMRGEA